MPVPPPQAPTNRRGRWARDQGEPGESQIRTIRFSLGRSRATPGEGDEATVVDLNQQPSGEGEEMVAVVEEIGSEEERIIPTKEEIRIILEEAPRSHRARSRRGGDPVPRRQLDDLRHDHVARRGRVDQRIAIVHRYARHEERAGAA